MKKIFLILLGIAIVLSGVIFVIYRKNESSNGEVVNIFKDKEESSEEEVKEDDTDKKEVKGKKVVVDIKGMVVNPGVYEVDSKARVNDVIAIAGGLIDGADTSKINLAKIVTDEMTIIIYSKEEILEKYKEEVCVCDCPVLSNDACIDSGSDEDALVNINTASKEELMKISGLGEAKADSIIKYREEHGAFKNIDDIKEVAGIGEALFEKIKVYITV